MTALGLYPAGVDRPVTLALAEIAHVLVPTDGIDGRLHRALELLREIVPYDRCAVVEGVPGGEPRVHLAPKLSPSEARAIEPALLRLLGLISESSRFLKDDPQTEEIESLRSYLAVPLVGSDDGDGLLLVSRGAADAYDEDDLRLLSIVASQIATFLTACRPLDHDARMVGQCVVSREAARGSDVRSGSGVAPAHIPRLTKRQFEVARLIAAGRSNAQIARELVLTTGTVANHIEHILRRLDVSNRAQVAAWDVERELRSYEAQR